MSARSSKAQGAAGDLAAEDTAARPDIEQHDQPRIDTVQKTALAAAPAWALADAD